jgi:hypothetical protein
MKVTFKEDGHVYESIPAVSWTSVTRVVEMFCPPFDELIQARKSAQNPNSRWFEMPIRKIVKLWQKERDRSTEAGSWFHHKMELKALKAGKKEHRGRMIPVYASPFVDGVKVARDQVLADGVYPEHLIYHDEIGVCGQSDLVFVADGYVDISDYKTNKEMKIRSYIDRFGQSQRMLPPLEHLDDCNFYHYALQLSIYMKLILMKNPALKPGKLTLIHVIFELQGTDQYGFPVLKRDENGYIVKEIVKYDAPYLEDEAIKVLKIMYRNAKSLR